MRFGALGRLRPQRAELRPSGVLSLFPLAHTPRGEGRCVSLGGFSRQECGECLGLGLIREGGGRNTAPE